MTRFFLRAALVAGAALCLAAPAMARDLDEYGGAEQVTAKVKVTDSDLRTAAGAKALAMRVRVAAAEVCGGEDPVIRESDGFARCQKASAARAMASLNAPRNLARSGR